MSLAAGSDAIAVVTNDGAGGVDTDMIAVTVTGGVTIIGSNGADTIDATHTVAGQPLPTEFGDRIEGRNGNDRMDGLAGNDLLVGGIGRDTIDGGEGNDTIHIGGSEATTDVMRGGAGSDAIVFTSSDVTLAAFDSSNPTGEASGSGIEFIDLGGTVTLAGTAGANMLDFSNTTFQNFAGVPGGILVDGGGGSDIIVAGSQGGIAFAGVKAYAGGAGSDTITGSFSDDKLFGNDGNDSLVGEEGNDLLVGGIGRDTIDGGSGVDELFGDTGNDSFVFKLGYGTDQIQDFEGAGVLVRDIIDLRGTGIVDFATLTHGGLYDTLLTNVVGTSHSQISLGDGSTLQINNVVAANLAASDFLFS